MKVHEIWYDIVMLSAEVAPPYMFIRPNPRKNLSV